MGIISRKIRDPFGFGNTEVAEKFAKFEAIPNLSGLKIAITGANAGLGFAAAKRLAENGADIIMLCRDLTRAEQAKNQMKGNVSIVQVDMSDYESIMKVALPKIDVLVHNAGAMFSKREVVKWPSGLIDQTFALHVLGPYLLSQRVTAENTIWVSSGGMYTTKLNVDKTVSPPDPFDGMDAYARCKRAQVVIARLLGHQSMHPGWAETDGVKTAMPKFYEKTNDILRTTDEGADTIVWLAAKRPKERGFWFDREIVTEYKMICTSHEKSEEEKLMLKLQELSSTNNGGKAKL